MWIRIQLLNNSAKSHNLPRPAKFQRKNLIFQYVFSSWSLYEYKNIQMEKYPQFKKSNYSLGAKGIPCFVEYISERFPYTSILLADVDQVRGSGAAKNESEPASLCRTRYILPNILSSILLLFLHPPPLQPHRRIDRIFFKSRRVS